MTPESFAREDHINVGGRRVGWTEWGEVDGRPVVFCTGAGMTSCMGFAAAAVRELGVRLVCIDRAGLGRSAPDPAKSLASYARDVAAVLDHLGVVRPGVIGFSQGGPFAVALAAADLASALALVSATDELAHPALRPLLPVDLTRLIDAIAGDPAGFETAFAAQVDADGLWRLVLELSDPHDRTLYEEPAFAAAYRATLAEGFAQGPAGYVRDLVLAMSPWPVAPEQVRIPVRMWYGALDTSPAHSPDLGATLAARFPHAVRRVLAGEGGSLLWTRSREVLADLVSAAAGGRGP